MVMRSGNMLTKLLHLSITVCCLTIGIACSDAADEHASHSGHEMTMTPEQMAGLREKISVYRDMTDEQIMADMMVMPNYDVYLSAKNVAGNVGVLLLNHGFGDRLNAELEKVMKPVSDKYPTAVAYGMVMESAAAIQSAVDRLEGAGAKNIVIIPFDTMKQTRLRRQWDYVFNLREEAEYLSVPRVKTGARIAFTENPSDAPVLATIMLDHARELSTDPKKEVLILVSHGPTFEKDNAADLAALERHAERIRQMGIFSAVRATTIQDDTRENIRGLNVEKLRSWIAEATAEGKRAIVVTNLVLLPSFAKKLKADLAGLDYKLSEKGVALHPGMADWIQQVASDQAQKM